jgi:CheY-specific phosphatase CheX
MPNFGGLCGVSERNERIIDELSDSAMALLTAMQHGHDYVAEDILRELLDSRESVAGIVGIYSGVIDNLMRQIEVATGVSVDEQMQEMAAYYAAHPYQGPS